MKLEAHPVPPGCNESFPFPVTNLIEVGTHSLSRRIHDDMFARPATHRVGILLLSQTEPRSPQ